MKKTLLLAFGLISLGASAQLKSESISYYSSSAAAPRIYDGHISNKIRWSSSNKKFEFTGNSWKDFNSILFGKDGDISFATAQVWQNALPGFLNNKINQQDFENNFVKMKLKYSGQLGLGTVNPQAKLHVEGTSDGNKSLLLTKNNTEIFFVNNISSGVSYSPSIKTGDFGIMFNDNSSGGSNQNAGFGIGPKGGVHGLRMDAKGNVGIGTDLSSNQYNGENNYFKLSVNGSIRAKEIVVETNWADFVFADDYKLMSLDKVEDFIEENNHLPGVPSAKSISENGLKVAESQTIQMQKIEELTLYTIEQQKLIQSLLDEVNNLKSEVKSIQK